MGRRVYISADYDKNSGDRDVVDTLNYWGKDNKHKVNFVDMAKVVSGSVSNNPDCRICDLKKEFNSQINSSSMVIIVVGDKTASRTAGNSCYRNNEEQSKSFCTPYKENSRGSQPCKVSRIYTPKENDDVGNINQYSYLRHEFEQAKKKRKKIIIVYNSLNKQPTWLPSYLKEYENEAHPFWKRNDSGQKVGNYTYIKQALGYD